MITKITSLQNSLVKEIVNIQTKSKLRKLNNLTVIEGLKEISIAKESNIKFEKILFCPDIIDLQEVYFLLGDEYDNIKMFEISKEVYSKISYRESTGGIIILAKTENKKLRELKTDDGSLFIILESVEKPGNLGAVCRIADAANVNGVIICDELTDIYNPNVIRASLGCVFSVNILTASFQEIMEWKKENEIKLFAAELKAAEFYHKCELTEKTALVFGTEANGLTQKWIDNADFRVKIPMLGKIDSLNISVAVAIMVFEAKRQKDFLP